MRYSSRIPAAVTMARHFAAAVLISPANGSGPRSPSREFLPVGRMPLRGGERGLQAPAGNAICGRRMQSSARPIWRDKQPAKALEAFSAGRDHVARQVTQFPDSPAWKRDLARFDLQISALKNGAMGPSATTR